MIDTRFPPQPHFIDVPLYPTKELPIFSEATSAEVLNGSLVSKFGGEREQWLVGDSASSLLREYFVTTEAKRSERVALPAFACQSLVDAVLDAGQYPVFCDVDEHASISLAAAEFAISHHCDTFIWPTYFGSKPRDETAIGALREADVAIVFDEAQSDPRSSEAATIRRNLEAGEIALYSFGWSKALAASGGGAIYCSKQDLTEFARLRQNVDDQPLASDDEARHVQGALLARINRFSPDFAVKNGFAAAPYDRLDMLLEARTHERNTNVRITPYHARHLLSRLASFDGERSNYIGRYDEIRETVRAVLGERSLTFLEGIDGTPTILALRTEADKRHDTMVYMATQGIQSTWYYYPLNCVSRYGKYEAQADAGSQAVAASIIILPFQSSHTDRQHDAVLGAIRKIPRSLR